MQFNFRLIFRTSHRISLKAVWMVFMVNQRFSTSISGQDGRQDILFSLLSMVYRILAFIPVHFSHWALSFIWDNLNLFKCMNYFNFGPFFADFDHLGEQRVYFSLGICIKISSFHLRNHQMIWLLEHHINIFVNCSSLLLPDRWVY